MESMYLKEIITGVHGKYSLDSHNPLIKNISTDSRQISQGDLFVPLEGDNFDGHDFIYQAVDKGAEAVLTHKPLSRLLPVPVIQVSDTGQALLDLAAYYRQRMEKPVIGVTGSVGKTSTKNIISAILAGKLHVHKTAGNFNNQIGLPLTIFRWAKEHDVLVAEMGMRGLGEISELTQVARPNIGVITNIGFSHLGRLGTQKNILQAKMEILKGMGKDGVLILNANDPLLAAVNLNFPGKIIYVGRDIKADFCAYNIDNQGEAGVSFMVRILGRSYKFHIPAMGEHNVHNALFGIACAVELGLTPEEMIVGLNSYQPEALRCNLLEKDGIKFIDDSYNASPDSMKSALEILVHLAQNKRSIAVLGNILELGDMAELGHYQVGEMCQELGVDFTAILGDNAENLAQGIGDKNKYRIFNSHQAIANYLKDCLKPGDVVLLKGSRGMEMEKILHLWEK